MQKTWLLPFALLFIFTSCLEDLSSTLPDKIGTVEANLSDPAWQTGVVGVSDEEMQDLGIYIAQNRMLQSSNIAGKVHMGTLFNFDSIPDSEDLERKPYLFVARKISTLDDGTALNPNAEYKASIRGEFCHGYIGETPLYGQVYFKWDALTIEPETTTDSEGVHKFKDLEIDSKNFSNLPVNTNFKENYNLSWSWVEGTYTFNKFITDEEGNAWVIIGIQLLESNEYYHLFEKIYIDVYKNE
ncbi:hypothetical protein [Sediminitomix flava]|uniref:Lipoprotein n=1 Tax=Sediminitomix flava TaxID=379075 RepID=A0A315ZB22_SEDFL|nr:hypothetical protein [Sediminitomix flava]PWJ42775.1 hypothetical protein BC781_102321 [Sediminitomix flava]